MSQFIEMFGEEQKISLGKICLIQKGATITRNEVTIGSIPVVAGGQEPSCYHNEANRNANMITISASGAYAGYVNYWEIPIFASDCNTISPKDTKQLDIIFLYNGLKAMQKEIYSLQKGGAQPHVYGKDLHNLLFPFPPFEHQQEFSDIVKQADKSKFIGFKSQFIEMSGDWERHKLDSFIDIVRGVSYKPTDVVDSNNPCATGILRANNISDGELNTVEMVYVNNERVSEIQKLRPKDIVMCASSGSQYLVGKAAINKHLHSNYAHGAFCLLIRCKELLMPEFLNLYLQTDDYRGQIEEKSCGSNILNIKQSDITSLIIPIPNFAVQQNFVTILKQADKSKYIN